MTRADLLEQLTAAEAMVLPIEFEPALVGIGQQFNRTFTLYDRERVLEIIMRDGGTYEEAAEHFEFNVQGAYVGEGTPAFIETLD